MKLAVCTTLYLVFVLLIIFGFFFAIGLIGTAEIGSPPQ